jgi:hypothetical protein
MNQRPGPGRSEPQSGNRPKGAPHGAPFLLGAMLRDRCSSCDLLLPLGYVDWHHGQSDAYPHSTGDSPWKSNHRLPCTPIRLRPSRMTRGSRFLCSGRTSCSRVQADGVGLLVFFCPSRRRSLFQRLIQEKTGRQTRTAEPPASNYRHRDAEHLWSALPSSWVRAMAMVSS